MRLWTSGSTLTLINLYFFECLVAGDHGTLYNLKRFHTPKPKQLFVDNISGIYGPTWAARVMILHTFEQVPYPRLKTKQRRNCGITGTHQCLGKTPGRKWTVVTDTRYRISQVGFWESVEWLSLFFGVATPPANAVSRRVDSDCMPEHLSTRWYRKVTSSKSWEIVS